MPIERFVNAVFLKSPYWFECWFNVGLSVGAYVGPVGCGVFVVPTMTVGANVGVGCSDAASDVLTMLVGANVGVGCSDAASDGNARGVGCGDAASDRDATRTSSAPAPAGDCRRVPLATIRTSPTTEHVRIT